MCNQKKILKFSEEHQDKLIIMKSTDGGTILKSSSIGYIDRPIKLWDFLFPQIRYSETEDHSLSNIKIIRLSGNSMLNLKNKNKISIKNY